MTDYSSYSNTADATTWEGRPADQGLRLFLLSPTVVFAASISQSSFTYPLAEVTYSDVTVGAYGDILPGQTVLFGSDPGLSDLGRQRIRKAADATKIYFSPSSEGARDGEVALAVNGDITVLDDYRVWSKPPRIDDDYVVYKDWDLAFVGNGDESPPVANGGPGVGITLANNGVATLDFDGTASFATHPEATIASYLWDVNDGTITVGTSADATITATFPAGFRWISLTVTDSNGKTHTNRIPVMVRDPDNDACINAFEIKSHHITPAGQTLSIRIIESIHTATYPDGTLVMLWDGDPSDAADRSNMLFVGWHQSDPASIQAFREGTLNEVTLECIDVAGRLASLPIWSQEIIHDAEPAAWNEMNEPNIDRFIHYLLAWHTTALTVANFTWSGTGATHKFNIMGVNEGNLFAQVNGRAQVMTPDYLFTCDRNGRLWLLPDPLLQDTADRTATVQADITVADWGGIQYIHQRPPRAYELKTYAVIASYDVEPTIAVTHAPGKVPGQGATRVERNNQLTPSQGILNSCEGHRYARLNNFQQEFSINIADWSLVRSLEPAQMTWVTLTISSATAAPRELSFTTERGLPKSLDIRYEMRREGVIRTATLLWERETSGIPAITFIEPVDSNTPDNEWWPPPPELEVPDVPEVPFYDPIQAYLLWDGAHVYRTMDLLAGGGPTWEFVDTGITGNIQDAQYVLVDADTVGIWLLTSNGIWWCADILAVTPSWSNVLPVATVQAADATPDTGSIVCKCMANYASAPGYLCVATGPQAIESANTTYEHAYFWHTHDYGQNWTQVDMNGILYTVGGTRGYCNSDLFAMEIFRSEPGTIYCIRTVPVIGLSDDTQVFISTDLGDTWAIAGYDINPGLNNRIDFSILHPFPSATDPSYIRAGDSGVSLRPSLRRSTDEWATGVTVTEVGINPSGYGGMSHLWRMNKRSDDVNHVLGWFRHSSTAKMHLLESEDRGATWALLYNSDLEQANIENTPNSTIGGCSAYSTPNGWPPDIDVWIIVRGNVLTGSTDEVVLFTDDRFATVQDKTGNLNTLLGGDNWTNGPAGGIALPKVGVNA